MSVFLYDEGDHGGGFVGARVAVMVGSKHRQKYFSFRCKSSPTGFVSFAKEEELKREAYALNEQWLAEQAEAEKHWKITTPTRGGTKTACETPALGLVCGFKPRYSSKKGHINSYRLMLGYNIREAGKRYTHTTTVTAYSDLEMQWRNTTKELARQRGLKRAPPRWNKGMPSLMELRQNYLLVCDRFGKPRECQWLQFATS